VNDPLNKDMGGNGSQPKTRHQSAYARLINRFSATRPGSWLVRNFAARLDPVIYSLTNGRFTITGVPTLPMLTLTCIGAKSGKERKVQLAYHSEGEDFYVVASAMGQEAHPAWRANLLANPEVTAQLPGRTLRLRATPLTETEKVQIWDRIVETIPQMSVYSQRTDRKLTVFRLSPVGN
jgi:deazaflavin-dependent oxidoreductase (nitroreductase family)